MRTFYVFLTIVAELTEAQKRTEQRVEELAEAQKRSEERLSRVEQRLDRLERKVDNMGKALGYLWTAFGSTVEEEAASMIVYVLKQKGYRVLGEPASLTLNGAEVDVVVAAEGPQGERIWALVKAKARLSVRDVRNWTHRLQSESWRKRLAKKGVAGPCLPYLYVITFEMGARQQVEESGIGLIRSSGEILAPREVLPPV